MRFDKNDQELARLVKMSFSDAPPLESSIEAMRIYPADNVGNSGSFRPREEIWAELETCELPPRIDRRKLIWYLSRISDEKQTHVLEIVKKTIHISQDELVASLYRCIDRLEEITPLYNLYIPKGKIGSDHWLLTLLEDRLSPQEILWGHEATSSVSNDYPFIVLDDAIYSCCHMTGIVDDIRYDTPITNHFYCLVAVSGRERPDVCDLGATVIADRYLPHLGVFEIFDKKTAKRVLKLFGVEGDCVLPLFFDHKIANEFGSYQFYHDIVSPPVSRAPVDAVTEDDVVALIERLLTRPCRL